MALQGVLSAMREIILDLRDIPTERAARASLYTARYPTLTPHEIEDLAAIEPADWHKYTASIFAGERNILLRYFETTFALLKRYWHEFSDTPFNPFELTRTVHTHRPWKGRSAQTLTRCFMDYLTIDRADIVSRYPEIAAVAALELVSPELRHAPDDRYKPTDSLTEKELSRLTVGELLKLTYYLPSTLRFHVFPIDAPQLHRDFVRDGNTLPEKIVAKPTWSIASRNHAGFVRWVNVPQRLHRFLDAQPRTTPLQLSEFAEAFIETDDAASSDSELFQRFFVILTEFLVVGTLILLPPQEP